MKLKKLFIIVTLLNFGLLQSAPALFGPGSLDEKLKAVNAIFDDIQKNGHLSRDNFDFAVKVLNELKGDNDLGNKIDSTAHYRDFLANKGFLPQGEDIKFAKASTNFHANIDQKLAMLNKYLESPDPEGITTQKAEQINKINQFLKLGLYALSLSELTEAKDILYALRSDTELLEAVDSNDVIRKYLIDKGLYPKDKAMLSGYQARNAFRAYLEEKLKPMLEQLKFENKLAAGHDLDKEYDKDQLVAEISRLNKRLDDLRADNKDLQDKSNAQQREINHLKILLQSYGVDL